VAARGLELITSLPDAERLIEQRLETLLLLAPSYELVGDLDHAEGTLAEAELLADQCPNDAIMAQIVMSAATLCWLQSHSSEAKQRFLRACDAWQRLGDDTRGAQALVGMGLCAIQRADRARGLELFTEAASRDEASAWARAGALSNDGVILLEDGRYNEAEPYLIEGLGANEQDSDRRGIAHSKCSLGELYYRLAKFSEAQHWLQEPAMEAADIEDAQCLALASAHLARTYFITDNHRVAAEALLNARAVAQSADYPEAEDVYRIAEMATAVMSADVPANRLDQVQGSPAAQSSISLDLDSPLEGRATRLNAYVESLCVAAESAILHDEASTGNQLADVLRKHLHLANDSHLRRYGQWPLKLLDDPDAYLRPLAQSKDAQRAVYDLRAQRLLMSLQAS